MEIVEKKVKLEGVDMLAFLGYNDANLNILESRFDTVITVRGDTVVLRGEPAETGMIEKIINEMIYLLHRNGSLLPKDVESVIDLVKGGRAEQQLQGQDLDEVILFAKEHVVKARGERQKEYYRLVRENDIVFSIGPAGTGKCIAGNSLVLTDRGMIPIAALAGDTSPDDQVPVSVTIHGLNGAESASHIYNGGVSDTLRIRTRFGYEITTTPEHPLLVLSTGGELTWRRADLLRTGDVVALQRGQRMFGTETAIDLTGIRRLPNDKSSKPVQIADLDADLAYIMGVLTGDGCLTARNRIILSSADETIVASFHRLAARFGLHVFRNGDDRPYDYIIASSQLYQLLGYLGLSLNRAAAKWIPSSILRAPQQIVAAFLQGLFDADATVDKRDGSISFSTVSKQLAAEVQTVLLNFGIVSSRGIKRGRYQGNTHESIILRIAGEDAETFDSLIGFRLLRKQELRRVERHNPNVDVIPNIAGVIDAAVRYGKFSRAEHKSLYDYRIGRRRPSYRTFSTIVQLLHEHEVEVMEVAHMEGLLQQHLLFLVVEEITPSRDHVYDLTVPETHSFVANGFVNHNTFLAVAMAVAAYRNREVTKLVLARPAVEAGESLGFLPGDLKEKIDPYLRPLYDALDDMIPSDKLKSMMEKHGIEVVPLAYMRGRTLNNAFVILDEAQNATTMQMKMFLTRLGANSRAIITGDLTQIDLPKNVESGLVQAESILRGIEGIGFVYFDKADVVRHRLVKDIIKAYEDHGIMGGM